MVTHESECKPYALISTNLDDGRASTLSESSLRENFFEQIIDMEAQFQKNKDIKCMHTLLELYKEGVEHYESKKNLLMQKEFMNKMHRIVVSKEYLDAVKTQRRVDRTKTISYKGNVPLKFEPPQLKNKGINIELIKEEAENVQQYEATNESSKPAGSIIKGILRGQSSSQTCSQITKVTSIDNLTPSTNTEIEKAQLSPNINSSVDPKLQIIDEFPQRTANKSKSIYINNPKVVEDLKKTLMSEETSKSVDLLISNDISKQTDSMKLKLQERKNKNFKKKIIRSRLSIEKSIVQNKSKKRRTLSKSPIKIIDCDNEYQGIMEHKKSNDKRTRAIKTRSTNNENYFRFGNQKKKSKNKKAAKSAPTISDQLNLVLQLVKDYLLFELNSKVEKMLEIVKDNTKVKTEKFKELQETQVDFEIMSKVSNDDNNEMLLTMIKSIEEEKEELFKESSSKVMSNLSTLFALNKEYLVDMVTNKLTDLNKKTITI